MSKECPKSLRVKNPKKVYYNPSYEELFEFEMQNREVVLTDLDAVNVDTGKFTGRRPKDKYFVNNELSKDDIEWGMVNKPIDEVIFNELDKMVLDYFEDKILFIFDGFVGVGACRKKVRIITEYAWQCHFVTNMFIRPTKEECKDFIPDFRLYNACKVSNYKFQKHGLYSEVFIMFNISKSIGIIGGTEYGGEMKKGLFTMMNYWLPKQNVLSMHCSANIAANGSSALFFGLSGTGKTTLSSDENRQLIGDDEHGWDDEGIFNMEGGCYAKCIHLDINKEPLIYKAVKRNALLENVHIEDNKVDFNKTSKSENTRVSYPIFHIPNHKKDLRGNHPDHIIFLSYDAFGVLPAVSKLDHNQAMYYFLSGYTAKVAGTEHGINEPTATFSACFGEAFLPLHPYVYAKLLGEKIRKYQTKVYLLNTGLIGGTFSDDNSRRMSIKETRSCLNSILDNSIENSEFDNFEIFNFKIPRTLNDINDTLLNPRNLWQDALKYDEQRKVLAELFIKNFDRYDTENNNFYDFVKSGPKI